MALSKQKFSENVSKGASVIVEYLEWRFCLGFRCRSGWALTIIFIVGRFYSSRSRWITAKEWTFVEIICGNSTFKVFLVQTTYSSKDIWANSEINKWIQDGMGFRCLAIKALYPDIGSIWAIRGNTSADGCTMRADLGRITKNNLVCQLFSYYLWAMGVNISNATTRGEKYWSLPAIPWSVALLTSLRLVSPKPICGRAGLAHSMEW